MFYKIICINKTKATQIICRYNEGVFSVLNFDMKILGAKT